MTHGSLFSGIGGFDLAAEWMGWTNVFQVEFDLFCQKVLKKNFPHANIYGDIREFDGRPYAGAIDVISGGFPCQPFSVAGKRKGEADDRHLWPEMLRVIREIAPAWVVGENVAGLISMDGGRVFEQICADLESLGYSPEAFVIPAIGVGAPHRRDRLWIAAHAERIGLPSGDEQRAQSRSVVTPSMGGQRSGHSFRSAWNRPPEFLLRHYGLSGKLDECAITALGNAIVPQVAHRIFQAIAQSNKSSAASITLSSNRLK